MMFGCRRFVSSWRRNTTSSYSHHILLPLRFYDAQSRFIFRQRFFYFGTTTTTTIPPSFTESADNNDPLVWDPSTNSPSPRSSKVTKAPRNYWADRSNQKRFFEWAATQLSIAQPADWYKIEIEQLTKLGGISCLKQYDKSLYRALSAVYPEHEWLPWKFTRTPQGIWSQPSIQRQFFDWAAKQLNIERLEGWYDVSLEDVTNLGGATLLCKYYGKSLPSALAAVYPEYDWLPWRFSKAPTGCWQDPANHKRFFEWAAKELNITKLEDWYDVTGEAISRLAGGALVKHYYCNTLSKALAAIYPEYEWLPWKFASAPKGTWSDLETQRKFFDWAAKQLSVDTDTPEGWYGVTRDDIFRLGGKPLLYGYYEGSLPKALAAVYPTLEWQPWMFKRFVLSKYGFNTQSELQTYIDFLSKELRIQQLDDWYRISVDHIRELGGYSIIAQNGGLFAVLSKLYPQHPWDAGQLTSNGKRSSQRWLFVAVQQLLQCAEQDIAEEYHHPDLCYGDSTEAMTLDLWIPSLSLAFEYHGAQHYHDFAVFGNPSSVQRRDSEKIDACRRAGISLVVVPYWWNRSLQDLAATIRFVRPDLATAGSPLERAAASGTPLVDARPQ